MKGGDGEEGANLSNKRGYEINSTQGPSCGSERGGTSIDCPNDGWSDRTDDTVFYQERTLGEGGWGERDEDILNLQCQCWDGH